MIQDILTYLFILLSIGFTLRSFIRFFTVRTKLDSHSNACGNCGKSCPMKGVMEGIDHLAVGHQKG
ncbi:MAG: hypothetical protein PF489_08690 [Salinivirgaceae bacterium]|jgi:hypothetical protein|nr:hypothetical protein [Salinivirgaceae bacterium]